MCGQQRESARAPAHPKNPRYLAQDSTTPYARNYGVITVQYLLTYLEAELAVPSFPAYLPQTCNLLSWVTRTLFRTWPQPARQFAGRAPSTGCGHRSTSSVSLPARTTAGRCPHSHSRNTRVPPGTRGPAARIRRSPQTVSPRCRPRAARRSVARAPSSACSLPDGSGRALSPLRGPAAVRVLGWVGWR